MKRPLEKLSAVYYFKESIKLCGAVSSGSVEVRCSGGGRPPSANPPHYRQGGGAGGVLVEPTLVSEYYAKDAREWMSGMLCELYEGDMTWSVVKNPLH